MRLKAAAAAAVGLALLAGYLLAGPAALPDAGAIRAWIVALGWLGPVCVVGLMALAIVVSPLPSAPIALAAGAAYGHGWGTVYVLAGAEAGAVVAFVLARYLGREFVARWVDARLGSGRLARQGALMAIVFASRLVPFISFDIVSYAAGLTPLAMWRFALATLAGIAPGSFVLAHFGAELVSADNARVTLAVGALGALVLAPFVVKAVISWWRGRRCGVRRA